MVSSVMTDFTIACERVVQPPLYISARSANSLISFSRPTRMQTVTLHYLNKTLDELLLHILSAAKSLATDRIKSDGILRVLGGQHGCGSGPGAQLAKSAVLEAELELRNYLDGQRKDGGKMPLGLSATSRFDGTAKFPVESAYKTLRIRCQYYSTLGELEDPSSHSTTEQNVMSAEGRPITTITPGVAIYVTALLEHVAEHILQSLAQIIERDNSDEAALNDLLKALEEDEATIFWWSKFKTRTEMEKEVTQRGASGKHGKVQKPWQVPDESEIHEAADSNRFKRNSTQWHASTMSHEPVTQSPSNQRSGATTPTLANVHTNGRNSLIFRNGDANGTQNSSDLRNSMSTPTGDPPSLKRRSSFDKAARFLTRRRGSRSSQDYTTDVPSFAQDHHDSANGSATADPSDSLPSPFNDLFMSGQTMKVSLTPNRLRSMASTNDEEYADGKPSTRQRPGTTILPNFPGSQASQRSSSVPPSSHQRSASNQHRGPPTPNKDTLDPSRPDSAMSKSSRYGKRAPPSAYRAVDNEQRNSSMPTTPDASIDTAMHLDRTREESTHLPPNPTGSIGSPTKAKTGDRVRQGHVRETVESYNGRGATSNSDGRSSRQSTASQDVAMKRSMLGSATGRMLGLFGRRSYNGDGEGSPVKARSRQPSRLSVDSNYTANDTSGLANDSSEGHDSVAKRDAEGSLNSTPSSSSDQRKDQFRKNVESYDGVDLRGSTENNPTLYEEPEEAEDAQNKAPRAQEQSDTPEDVAMNGREADADDQGMSSRTMYHHQRANNSSSTISSRSQTARAAADSTNRKIPWGYNRISGAHRQSVSMNGAQKRVSGSSQGNHSDAHQTSPPSAWGPAQVARESHAGNASTSSDTSIEKPRALAGSPLSMRAVSPSPWAPGVSKTDIARILAQLNQKIREAGSVEECQRLVLQALAVTAAAVHDDTVPMRQTQSTSESVPQSNGEASSLLNDIPDEDSVHTGSVRDGKQKDALESEDSAAKPSLARSASNVQSSLAHSAISRPIKYRNLLLPMSIGYDANEDDSLPRFQREGAIAAWLLGGDDDIDDVILCDKPAFEVHDEGAPGAQGSRPLSDAQSEAASLQPSFVTASDSACNRTTARTGISTALREQEVVAL